MDERIRGDGDSAENAVVMVAAPSVVAEPWVVFAAVLSVVHL
jgi:hypothetical protein